MEKKTINEVLSQMKLRIINEETTEGQYLDTMAAEQFEEDPSKCIFEFTVQDGTVEVWALDYSGKVFYCETVHDAVDALNMAIENGETADNEYNSDKEISDEQQASAPSLED